MSCYTVGTGGRFHLFCKIIFHNLEIAFLTRIYRPTMGPKAPNPLLQSQSPSIL